MKLQRKIEKPTGSLTDIELSIVRAKEITEKNAELIYSITHDLKNPLAAIQSSVEIIKRKQEILAPELLHHTKTYFDIVFSEVIKIALLLKNISSISTIGLIELNKTETDPAIFMDELMRTSFLEPFQNDQIKVTLQGEKNHILIDQKLFGLAIVNLLSDALQQNENMKFVDLHVVSTNSDIQFIFRDYRALVSIQQKNNIDKMISSQTEQDLMSQNAWGMMIVKRVVNLHGGTIRFVIDSGMETDLIVTIPS